MAKKKKKKKLPKLRFLKKLTVCLAIALVVLCVVGAVCIRSMTRLYDNVIELVEREGSEATFPPYPTLNPITNVLRMDVDYYETGEAEVQEVPIYSKTQRDRFITSFLIVVHNGSTEDANPQTDMMFIASFNALKQKFTVVSLMRDMLVPIEDYGWKRLNAAYSLGGMGLLINTVNSVFDLDIQNYVYIGTEDLKALADIIGGVPAKLTEEEAAYINQKCGSSLTGGKQTLSGEQAITHLLDRTSGGNGDFGRADRQIRLVNSTLSYLRLNQDLDQMTDLFAKIIKRVRTNLDLETLSGIGKEVIRTDKLAFEGVRVPFDESYTETSQDGAFAVIPDLEKNQLLLQQALYSKE